MLEDSETSFEDAGDGIWNHEPQGFSFMDDPLLPKLVKGLEEKATAPFSQITANVRDRPIPFGVMSLSFGKIKTRPILERDENQIGQASISHVSARYFEK